ncbi:hypothetical protein [Persicobacter sp. CCB-QB2]|uniref:hypothetical protein n=1 Tax=Persicobacter sp. CCB-QB2 TaxID=1561025 RepID=UPI0006A9A039|nr:hypothetical protein [Persicobacter sp. CCB-QB2]
MRYAQNRNKLLLIQDIQNIHLEKKEESRGGFSNRFIWREFIYPTYRIAENTYYEYLRTPAKRLLKKLEEQPAQMNLF